MNFLEITCNVLILIFDLFILGIFVFCFSALLSYFWSKHNKKRVYYEQQNMQCSIERGKEEVTSILPFTLVVAYSLILFLIILSAQYPSVPNIINIFFNSVNTGE